MDYLKNLEKKVGAACQQIEALRKQNRGLKTRVKKLESELADSSNGSDWSKERAEVRKRVERLTAGLESLL